MSVPNPSWPSVTVLVPVHGDDGGLSLTLDALNGQRYDGPVDVVVIDNGANYDLPGTVEGRPGVTVVTESQPGSYAARNAGLQRAAGEVLAFTDADCLPRPDWLANGVRVLLDQPGPAFVGGAINVFAADPSHPSWAESFDCVSGLPQERYVRRHGWAATANMMTLRSTFDRVGPFEQNLRSGGDREWGQRAVQAGVAAIFAADATVDHPARATASELHAKVRRVVRGDVDSRRLTGTPMFDPGSIGPALRPHTRSILQESTKLGSRRARLGYVLTAHWMQYASFFAKVHTVMSTRSATSSSAQEPTLPKKHLGVGA